MDLEALVARIDGFSEWSHAEKIRFLAWYALKCGKREFTQADIRRCYEDLHLSPPTSFGSFISAMTGRNPKEAIRTPTGFVLERRVREAFDEKYGNRESTVAVHKLLAELPSRVQSPVERVFLDEALVCFRGGAFRGAMVMVWNLAFDHLCRFILASDLLAFNVQLPKSFPNADISEIRTREDFAELKESQVLRVCRSANIIPGNLHTILEEKLKRRNMAAHPSTVVISQLTAEDFIKDLVENVVLALA